MKSGLKKTWNAITTILVVAVVLVAIALAGVRVFGLQVYTVLSGSMEPTYHVGALIYDKKVDPQQLQPGDVITFMVDEDTIATHRIVEIVPDEEDSSVIRFRTKGDANDTEDGALVHYKNVLGTPVFTIPKMGYFANFVQQPPGLYIAIAFGAVLILMAFLPDMLDGDKSKKEKKDGHAA